MSREFDELLSAYLDGEVTPEERAAVERRLEQSPGMRETLEELSEVGDLIRKLPRAKAPVDLSERVVAAIGAKPLASGSAAATQRRLWRSWPLLAAGTVLAAGIAVVVLLPNQQANVATNDFALTPEPKAAPVIMEEALDRKLVATDSDGVTRLPTEAETAGAGTEASSLALSVQQLGRPPRPGEVINQLIVNAGQTQVLQYHVVDTQQAGQTLTTIFAKNGVDVIATETTVPPTNSVAAGDRQYWYFEGPAEQVDKTLNDFATVFTSVEDLGPLAESDQPMTPFFADDQPWNDHFQVQPRLKDEVLVDANPPASSPAATAQSPRVPRPAPPLAVESPGIAANPAPAAKASESVASAAAGSQRLPPEAAPAPRDNVEPGKTMEAKEIALPALAGTVVDKPNAPSTKSRAEGSVKVLFGNDVANPPAGNRGVSAQLDAGVTTQLVEPMLRNRALGNSNQRGAALENRYTLPRSYAADPKSGGERAQKTPALGEAESSRNSTDFRLGQMRNGSMPQGRGLVEGNAAATRESTAGNQGPRVSRALIILQRGTPAADAAPAEPVPGAPAKPN